jgi:hypothetical protein
LCVALAAEGLHVVGYRSLEFKGNTTRPVQGTSLAELAGEIPGGVHLSLVSVQLPSTIGALLGSTALSRFTIDVPSKLAKVTPVPFLQILRWES